MECSGHGEVDLWKTDFGQDPIYTMTKLKAVNQHLVDCYQELSHMKSDKVTRTGEFKRCFHSKIRRTHVSAGLILYLI